MKEKRKELKTGIENRKAIFEIQKHQKRYKEQIQKQEIKSRIEKELKVGNKKRVDDSRPIREKVVVMKITSEF